MQSVNGKNSDYTSQLFSNIGKSLYLSDETTDFHFIFETGRSEVELVPVHKFLLAAVSRGFHEKFKGPWKEIRNVKIDDFTASAFKEFLQFFYMSSVKLTKKNVFEVMQLAKMYEVDECSKVCHQFVQKYHSL